MRASACTKWHICNVCAFQWLHYRLQFVYMCTLCIVHCSSCILHQLYSVHCVQCALCIVHYTLLLTLPLPLPTTRQQGVHHQGTMISPLSKANSFSSQDDSSSVHSGANICDQNIIFPASGLLICRAVRWQTLEKGENISVPYSSRLCWFFTWR